MTNHNNQQPQTTIFKALRKESGGHTIPTLGFNVDRIEFDGLRMTLYVYTRVIADFLMIMFALILYVITDGILEGSTDCDLYGTIILPKFKVFLIHFAF